MGDDSKKRLLRYPGRYLDVQWDGRLCVHAGECVRAEGGVFVADREPWCDPNQTHAPDVSRIVERCPTGALTFERKDGGPAEHPPSQNFVVVANNGPYYVRGKLSIDGAPADMPGVKMRAALCRCGHSKNKPFCDNSHEEAGFRDHGAIGRTGDGAPDDGGPLAIKPEQDGPLRFQGNLGLVTASGRVAWIGTKVALCRCGQSKNKPFCDASHKAAGFKSE